MSKIEKFQDLICWQKTRVIVKDIYKVTSTGNFSRDYSLKDQIRRASNSVMLNIAEGFCGRTHNEFKHLLFVAFGSNGEVQSALYIALDQNYITEEIFKEIYDKCEENAKIISGLLKTL